MLSFNNPYFVVKDLVRNYVMSNFLFLFGQWFYLNFTSLSVIRRAVHLLNESIQLQYLHIL
jgi:hypothetical protein